MDFDEVKQLEINFKDHNYSFFINTRIESAHMLYTKPLGIFSDRPHEKVDIQQRLVEEIQKDECRSFVVLGDAGSGKTSLALHLCNEYWKIISPKSYDEIKKNNFYVPIYISLRQVELQNDCKNILSTFCDISPGKMKAANLANWNLLLFLDGYDELKEKINLWNHNSWWLPERSKKVKTVTFCKSIGLKESEREEYFLFGDNERSKFVSIQTFASGQIGDYVEKTIEFLRNISITKESVNNDPWFMTKKVTKRNVAWETDSAEYKKWLNTTFPDLSKLAGNPHLLTIILQILPGIVEECKESASELRDSEQEKAIRVMCSTEVGIYDKFVAQWFRYQATKNLKLKLSPGLIEIPLDHVAGFMLAYAQNLAFSLISKNGGFLGDGSILETDCNLWNLWKPIHNKELLDLVDSNIKYSKLFPKDQRDEDKFCRDNLMELRNACFLSKLDAKTFKFFHSSLVEYLSSREVFENVRGRFNFYLNSDETIYDNDFGINVNDITDKAYQPLLANLAQRAQTDESFRNLLFSIIDGSREILILSRMSANAITILSLAGICLSGRSFKNVQIAGANLSGGNFANSDFQFANLAGVNLKQSWMVGCKFQGASFEKVNFGQNCSLNLGTDLVIGIVPYIRDGKCNLIISFDNKKVLNYAFDNELLREIQCQNNNDKFFQCIEGGVLLTQKLSQKLSAFYQFTSLATILTVDVWNLILNKPMESIIVDHLNPTLSPTKLWISSEFLQDKSDSSPSTSTAMLETRKDEVLLEEQQFLNNIEGKESFHYYEVHSCQRGNVGLITLWGYIVKGHTIMKYRDPQILKTFPILTNERDETIFRFYSDFPVFGCDDYLNKLVAIKGENFVLIFSIVPTYKLIFKQNFPAYICDNEDIKFSSNGQYLIYKSDFVYLCTINNVKVTSTVKLLEVNPEDSTNFFVVYDKSCQMAAFSYDDSVLICTLPVGTIIQKMYTQNGLVLSLFPTFAFIDQTSEGTGNSNLLFYVSNNSNQTSLETIVISEGNELLSYQNVKGLSKIFVSDDNHRVASFSAISPSTDTTRRNILSVFNTPISSQSLLFQKDINSTIYDMVFTPNYLLVKVNARFLVLDMNGTFYQSIEFPSDCIVSTHVSSKYQRIVVCINETIQLCKIVETENTESPVTFENPERNVSILQFTVGRLTFDSKDGSHILLADIRHGDNVWLWVPSKNSCVKILLTDVSLSMGLHAINNFHISYEGNERNVCVTNYFGYYFIKISSDNFVKSAAPQKNKYCLYHHGYKGIMSRFYLNVGWYVYGNSDGKFFVHYLKSNELLAEFLFPHPVEKFNFHFTHDRSGAVLEAVDILAWDSDGNISSLLIDNINLKIASDPPNPIAFRKWKLWTVKSNSVLNFQNSIIAKTFNLNESNKRLLNHFNVSSFGEPWPEKIAYFSLSELYAPITEAESKFVIINTEVDGGPRMPLMADMWVVSVVAKNSKSNSSRTANVEHVGLLLEGINNGRHFAMEGELTANKSKGFVRIKLVPVTAMKRINELKADYIARQWMRPKSDVQKLIESIQADQLEDGRKYNLLRNNCATWCIDKLKEIGIKKDRRKWYRKVFIADLPSDLFKIKNRIVKNRLPFNPSKSA